MTNDIVNFCAVCGVYIDGAGIILLQKFFRKVYAIGQSNKKITLEKLNGIFLDIFHKQKHCTKTKNAVLVAGDIACGMCAGTYEIKNILAQDSCDCGQEV